MKQLLVLVCALVASSASAAEVVGRASLTLFTDGAFRSSPEIVTIRITQRDNGKISGGVDFGGGTINLEKKDGVWKGYAYNGFVSLGCKAEATACEGSAQQGGARIKLASDGRLEGSVNFTSFDAVNTEDRIEVTSDGSLRLDRNRDGSFSGRGYLPSSRFGELPQGFSADFEGEGTLARITDPALFTIFFVTPFARDLNR